MSKKTPCEYCEYKSVCNFDPKLKNNEYRYIRNMSKDYVMDEIMSREE